MRDWFGYERPDYTLNEIDSPEDRINEIISFREVVSRLENKEFVTLVEVGAGYGPWCMALAGLRKDKYLTVAIEACPDYVKTLYEYLKGQGINSIIEHAAISNKSGECRFNSDWIPFGQAITFNGRVKGSKTIGKIWGLVNIIFKRTVFVPMMTLDEVAKKHHLKHIDIIHMDIQGAEVEAIEGATDLIESKLIDYLMIGTHHKTINDKIESILSEKFELEINRYPSKESDGFQVWKRKDINEEKD